MNKPMARYFAYMSLVAVIVMVTAYVVFVLPMSHGGVVDQYEVRVPELGAVDIVNPGRGRIVVEGRLYDCVEIGERTLLPAAARVYAYRDARPVNGSPNLWEPVNGSGLICTGVMDRVEGWGSITVYAGGDIRVTLYKAPSLPAMIAGVAVSALISLLGPELLHREYWFLSIPHGFAVGLTLFALLDQVLP